MHMKKVCTLAMFSVLFLGGGAIAPVRAQQEVCFCHNVLHNPHTICTSNQGRINGHLGHVNNGTDTAGECPVSTPTATPTPTPSATVTPTTSPSPTVTPTGTLTPTVTPTITPPTPTVTPHGPFECFQDPKWQMPRLTPYIYQSTFPTSR